MAGAEGFGKTVAGRFRLGIAHPFAQNLSAIAHNQGAEWARMHLAPSPGIEGLDDDTDIAVNEAALDGRVRLHA